MERDQICMRETDVERDRLQARDILGYQLWHDRCIGLEPAAIDGVYAPQLLRSLPDGSGRPPLKLRSVVIFPIEHTDHLSGASV